MTIEKTMFEGDSKVTISTDNIPMDALAGVLRKMAKNISEEVRAERRIGDAERWLEALNEVLHSGTAVLKLPSENPTGNEGGEIIGWHDGNGGCYLLPAITRANVRDYDPLAGQYDFRDEFFSPTHLYSQLDALGVVASKGTDGVLTEKTLGSKHKKLSKVLHLNSKFSNF